MWTDTPEITFWLSVPTDIVTFVFVCDIYLTPAGLVILTLLVFSPSKLSMLYTAST